MKFGIWALKKGSPIPCGGGYQQRGGNLAATNTYVFYTLKKKLNRFGKGWGNNSRWAFRSYRSTQRWAITFIFCPGGPEYIYFVQCAAIIIFSLKELIFLVLSKKMFENPLTSCTSQNIRCFDIDSHSFNSKCTMHSDFSKILHWFT